MDTKDYAENPGKYELFRTARLAVPSFGGFVQGEIVSVQYVGWDVSDDGEKFPVYETEKNGEVWHLFGSAFDNFVL